MSLFHLGKKKEKTPQCECSGACSSQEMTERESTCCADAEGSICCIKVLGSGCKSCHELFENVQKVVESMKIPVEAEYVTDMQKVMEYGVMSMPALVINEKVVSMGKVLKPKELENLFQKYGS